MRRVTIDFAPSARRGYPIEIAVLALGLIATGLTTWAYVVMDERNAELTDRVGTMQREIARGRLAWAETGGKSVSPQSASAQGRTGTEWVSLMERLERSVDDSVTFLLLQAGATDGVLEILAEAKDRAAMFAFMGRLAHEGGFEATALRHHEIVADHPYKPVRFSLSAKSEHDRGGK